jgi:NADPH:quinone reductase-like Zn-dependent oxidoreductase
MAVILSHRNYLLHPVTILPGAWIQLGEGVTGIMEGGYVAALNPEFGCYAEYICVRPELLVPVPEALDPAEVVSLILNYLTAHCILHKKGHLHEKETVLIHASVRLYYS